MKTFKRTSFLLMLCLTSVLFAQKRTEDFSISFPDKKLEKSYYKTIQLIDNRIDTTSLGIVQKGAFNAKAKVVPTSSLSDQFQKLLDNINGDNTENGNIVIHLKQLYFAEVTGAFNEHGYCYFQAFLFAKNDDGTYSYLDKIDKVIDHSSMDVTKATMKKGSEMVSDFISRNISKKASNTDHYSFADIKNFDSIEKQKLNLYSYPELKDGVYKDYETFRDQQPERAITNVKFYGKAPKIIKIYETIDGKEKEIKKNSNYAIVYKGEPYIYTSIDDLFAKAEKRNDDYYFTGKVKGTAKTGNVVLASAFFGIIGGLIASGPVATPFELKIDYLNGGFIPIREVKN
ncbi:hypothetical protein ABXT08_03440 [Chryseobacterium sp. NRRL B-14859]|uniref:hypothetical protein n=1 Tax=Chryseobacterium sp. NRRL B-14859 TaxID=1562763 RepID=UPI003391391C